MTLLLDVFLVLSGQAEDINRMVFQQKDVTAYLLTATGVGKQHGSGG